MEQNNNFLNAQKALIKNLINLHKELLNLNKLIIDRYPISIESPSAGKAIIAKLRNMQSNS